MKKLRFYILSVLLTGFCGIAYPTQINENEALNKVKQFYRQRIETTLRSLPALHLIYTSRDTVQHLRSSNNAAYYYIFNVGENQGFVLVSGDDATKSILGYSDQGTFSIENMPENLRNWLDFYQSEIKFAMENRQHTTMPNTFNTALQISSNTVKPLLGNIKWNQGKPYNILCPFDIASNESTVTGCAATAMAQIMKYHQYPSKGIGSHSYTSVNYGTLLADFGKTTYDWSNMLEEYTSTSTSTQNTAVSTLMYHLGVSMEMNYKTAANGGSGAFDEKVALALIQHFGYDKDIQLYSRSLYTEIDWENLIKNELDAFRPVYYSGSSGNTGHAFVCDGYDSNNLFHINWGWGGLSNGYFELSSLEQYSSGVGASMGGYSQNQAVIAGIRKEDGMNNIIYQIGSYMKGLSSSDSILNNIETDVFDLNFGFANLGIQNFSGKIGIGLYKDGLFQKEIHSSELNIPSNQYSDNQTIAELSLSKTASGIYQLFCNYQPANSSDWLLFRSNSKLNNHLNVVVTEHSATLKKPTSSPSLVLTQAIQQIGSIYKNKTANFNVTVKNTGGEFYSNMGVKIYSEKPPFHYQYVKYGTVCLSPGETKNISFIGKITCDPGSYFAVAMYDSTNNFSSLDFKGLGPKTLSPIPVKILNENTIDPEEGKKIEFSINPNPVKDLLNILTTKNVDQARISDLSGKILLNFENKKVLEVSHLKPGVYILRIHTDGLLRTLKFIKE